MNKASSLPFYFAGLFVITFYAYWLYWPIESTLIQAHDFLDSIFVYFVTRSHAEGFFFNPDYTVSVFQDLPLNALAMRDLGLGAFYYELFSPSGAVAINSVITMFLGFSGFFLLARDYVLAKDKKTIAAFLIIVIASVLFATLPFKQQRLSGVSMIPLLFWATLNLYHGRHKALSFLAFGFYPFVAFLHYNGFAVALAMVFGTSGLVFKRHKKAMTFIALTAFTGVIYCLLEYRSLLVALHPAYDIGSHRGADQAAVFPDFSLAATWFELIKKMFLATGHHHMIVDLFAVSFASYIIFASLALVMIIKKFEWKAEYGCSAISAQKIGIIILVCGPILGLINFFDVYLNILQNTVGIPLSLRRIDSFSLPLFFTALTAVLLSLVPAEKNSKQILRNVFLCGCIGLIIIMSLASNRYARFRFKEDIGLARNFSTTQMMKSLLMDQKSNAQRGDIRKQKFTIYPYGFLMYTEAEYFMREAFIEIDDVLEKNIGPKNSYKIMHVGLSPSIGPYHGYRAIDGYFFNYPTKMFYENFWPVIAPEAKLKGQKENDVVPGGRLYSPLSAEHFNLGVISPHYDWCAFTEQGGRAIFSGYEIGNAKERGLKLLTHTGEIFVYGLDSQTVCALNQSHD